MTDLIYGQKDGFQYLLLVGIESSWYAIASEIELCFVN